VFVDETGAKTNMTRLRGRSEGGKRLVASAPGGHWCTTTLLSSMRLDAGTAAMVIESATDRDVFLAYVREILVPTLRAGDIVVMDNLSPHKTPAVAEIVRAAGAEVWYLPPYSPDFNPIEQMWSKVKAFLRDSPHAVTVTTVVENEDTQPVVVEPPNIVQPVRNVSGVPVTKEYQC